MGKTVTAEDDCAPGQAGMPERRVVEEAVICTAEEFGVDPERLTARGRSREVADARHMAMYLARESGAYVLWIAERFGMCSQSVYYGIATTAQQIRIYPALRERCEQVRRRLAERRATGVTG